MVIQKYENIKICGKYLEYEDSSDKHEKHRSEDIPSIDEFRHQVLNIDFNKFYNSIGGKKARDNKLETYKIPAMVHTYYYLFATTGCVPTPEEVCNAYIEKYVNVFLDGKRGALYKEFKPDGVDLAFELNDLKGRICRAYNSWHRELDLLLNLIEKYGDEYNFYYSFFDDYIKGVDIVVYDKKKNRCDISTYFSSGISKDYKVVKNTTRHEYKNKTLDVIAYFDGEKKNVIPIGDAFVYDDSVVNSVYAELKSHEEPVVSPTVINPAV